MNYVCPKCERPFKKFAVDRTLPVTSPCCKVEAIPTPGYRWENGKVT